MRWTRFLLLALALVLLFAGAGLTFLLTLDLNDHKTKIERFVTEKTGRHFVIDGRIDFDPGAQMGLSITDVRFGNPEWASVEDMARVGRATVVLNLHSLWSGPTIVELLEIENAELNLEQRSSGVNNWTFGVDGQGADGGPVALILREAHITNFVLKVTAPALDRPLELRVSRLDQVQNSDDLFDAILHGTLNEHAIELTGQYGPLKSLISASDLTVDISGQFDTLSIRAKGLIDDLAQPRRPRAEIEIRGSDIAAVTRMFGLPDVGGGSLDLNLSLQPGAGRVIASVKGNVGEHQVDLDGSATRLDSFEQSAMRLAMHGPDLSALMRLFGWSQFPPGPYRIAGSVQRDGPRLDIDEVNIDFGAAHLRVDGQLSRFPDLNDAELSLDISGERMSHFTRLFGLPGVVEGPFHITGGLKIAADGAEMVTLSAVTQIAELSINGSIGKESRFVGTRVHITGHGESIAAIGGAFDYPMPVDESFSFVGDIEIGRDVVLVPDGVTVTVGDNRLVADGSVGFDPLGDDTDVHIRVDGADLARVAEMAGFVAGVPHADYELSGRLQTPPDGYRVSDLRARVGDAQISVDGLVSHHEKFAGTRLKVSAAGPELAEFIADTQTMDFADGPFELSGGFELLTDAVRLTDVKLQLGGATASVNADIELPLAAANGTFDLVASGASFGAVLPDTGAWEPPGEPFEIRVQGRLADGLLHVDPATVQIGDARLTADGVFDMPPDLSRTSLAIAMRVASLATIGTFDQRYLPSTNFSLDAQFSGTPQSFSIDELTILSGGSDLTGSMVVHLDREVPDVVLQLQSSLLDVTPLFKNNDEPISDGDGDDDAVDGNEAGDGRLIPDWTLPLEQLTRFNAAIDVGIGKYRQNLREIDNIVIEAGVLDGQLKVERASGKTAYGSVLATLHVAPVADSARVQITIDGENVFFGDSRNRTREDMENEPKYEIIIALDGSGATLRDIAAGLNGRIKVSSDDGQIRNTALRFLYGDFLSELITAMNPFTKTDPYTKISCIVFVADIENGQLDANPGLAIQTDKLNIISKGDIDLRTEKLDFGFQTVPRKIISISAGEFVNPYLKVAGTLSKPHLTLDTTGTLVLGGAAVATAGLALLAKPVLDRLFAATDPCAEVIKRAEKKRQKKKK